MSFAKNFFPIIFLILFFNFFVISPVSPESPKRIISLAPNVTEILFAMGLGDNIVGVTSYCDYPPAAKKKQKIGGMSNPSLEAIVSLKPDIVVITTDGNPKEIRDRLHSLKIKTYVFKARRLSELPQAIRQMGQALGIEEKAEKLAMPIENSIDSFSRNKEICESENHAGRKRILFIIWPEPLIVAGPGTAINDVFELLGCDNIAKEAKTSYPKYSIEEIIYQSPDVIFIGEGHERIKGISSKLLKRLENVPAVKTGKVFFVSDSLYRLGPRIIDVISDIKECLDK